MSDEPILPIADRIEDVPLPSENATLFGHQAAEQAFVSAHKSGRLHHAWLISGARGVGKATLAFRIARFLLSHPDAASAPDQLGDTEPDDPVFRQIAQGAHPNLLHLSRAFDSKAKKFKTRLTVDEIRRTQAFYGMTAGAGRWRITIVDTADDMNASATNALLKILEEPPKNALFLVLANRPGRLLPTVRSRCRALNLQALSSPDMETALTALEQKLPSDKARKAELFELAEGSVRRAIELMSGDALATNQLIRSLAATSDTPDWPKIHDLADRLARREKQDDYALFTDLILTYIGQQVRGKSAPPAALARWAQVWEKTNRSIQLADSYNLDKKQVILSVFRSLADAR